MLRRTFRFILRFGFFILVLLVIIVGGLALLALVGPEGTVNFKKTAGCGLVVHQHHPLAGDRRHHPLPAEICRQTRRTLRAGAGRLD